MSYTSNYTIKHKVYVSVWTHEHTQTGKTTIQMRENFQQRFGQEAPHKQTLLQREHKLFATSNIKDTPRTGRPSNSGRQCGLIEEFVAGSPQ
jgi:hypothetical protein